MSTVHYSAAELANVVAACMTFPEQRAALIERMAEVAKVNAFAVNAHYKMDEATVTAEEIERAIPLMATLDRAVATVTMLESNCDGFMNSRLTAEVGRMACTLARSLMIKATEQRDSITYLQRELSEARKEIAALKVKTARKPRAVKGHEDLSKR